MKIIFHNDDFGVSHGVNSGIKDSFLKGLTTSASIRTNGPAFNEAVQLAKTKLKGMGLGLHLNLTDGKTHLPFLANSKGFYKYNFLTYLLFSYNRKIRKAIEKELDFQFKIAKTSGLKIDHVDGQDHIHMIPRIFEIVCKLCKKYCVRNIRLSREPYHHVGSREDFRPFFNSSILKLAVLNYLAKKNLAILKKYNMRSTDAFYGVLHTNFMVTPTIKAAIINAQKLGSKTIQITSHPAKINNPKDKIYSSPFFAKYANLENRRKEFVTLLDPELIKFIKENNIRLRTFKNSD